MSGTSKLVAQGLRDNKLPIAAQLRDDFPVFDPQHPDKAASFTIPLNLSNRGRPPQGG